jgi:tRNA threonylcarbamoyladenosine biosynthesis protein TsaB
VKLLALDTSTDLCSAALWVNGRFATRERLAPRAQGEHILPMIDELLAEAGIGLAALDAIAFGRGPGAFTGLRLACAVAQGLGFAAGRPLIPVSDLRALAAQALAARGDEASPAAEATLIQAASAGPLAITRALICQDARMEEVYWGCFEQRAAGLMAVQEEAVGPAAAVAWPSAWAPGIPVCGAGSGFAAYPTLRERLGERLATLRADLAPRAIDIARLALADSAAGIAAPLDPEQVLPVYLRNRVVT